MAQPRKPHHLTPAGPGPAHQAHPPSQGPPPPSLPLGPAPSSLFTCAWVVGARPQPGLQTPESPRTGQGASGSPKALPRRRTSGPRVTPGPILTLRSRPPSSRLSESPAPHSRRPPDRGRLQAPLHPTAIGRVPQARHAPPLPLRRASGTAGGSSEGRGGWEPRPRR